MHALCGIVHVIIVHVPALRCATEVFRLLTSTSHILKRLYAIYMAYLAGQDLLSHNPAKLYECGIQDQKEVAEFLVDCACHVKDLATFAMDAGFIYDAMVDDFVQMCQSSFRHEYRFNGCVCSLYVNELLQCHPHCVFTGQLQAS